MPTYDYLCQNCGHEFEKFESMSASPAKKCPKCGKLKLKRLIGSGAGIIFKGTGFYETDYRSEKYNTAVKKETAQTDPAEKNEKKEADKTPDQKPKEGPKGKSKKKTA